MVVKYSLWIHVLLHKDLLALSITWCTSVGLCVCVARERGETEITLFPQKSISANRIAFSLRLAFSCVSFLFLLPPQPPPPRLTPPRSIHTKNPPRTPQKTKNTPNNPLPSPPPPPFHSSFQYSLLSRPSSPHTEHQLHFITSSLAAGPPQRRRSSLGVRKTIDCGGKLEPVRACVKRACVRASRHVCESYLL